MSRDAGHRLHDPVIECGPVDARCGTIYIVPDLFDHLLAVSRIPGCIVSDVSNSHPYACEERA
jgi:hypothetical protein